MRIIAAIPVDLDESPIGTRPRFADKIEGRNLLARTVDQVAKAARLDGVFVVCPADQEPACRALLSDAPAHLRTHNAARPPYHRLVRTARKWSLDAWRGGIGGVSVMDEYAHTPVLAGLAQQQAADAVVVVPGPCPLIDPVRIDAVIDHFATVSDDVRMAFMQTPPGLSAPVFRTDLLAALAKENAPPGWMLAYKPDRPELDAALRSCACPSSQPLRHASGRLIADTDRAIETIREYLSAHSYSSAEHVGQWLIERDASFVPRIPREIEIELTTDDPWRAESPTPLRPRVPADQRRGPIDPAIVRRVAEELSAYDDSLVVLGGFGDPLMHPDFRDVLRHLREAGVYGIAVSTSGHALNDAAIEALIEHKVDVLSVFLDAWTPERYRELHGRDVQPVLDALEKLSQVRHSRQQVEPLIVPQMLKSTHTVDEMDAFFDGCLRKFGWATIVGYSNYAGRLPDHSVVDMSPPTRSACRRIRSRCTVLADGRVLACDQDFLAARPIGSLQDHSLADLWTGLPMTALRTHHADARYDADPLCPTCPEWHRP